MRQRNRRKLEQIIYREIIVLKKKKYIESILAVPMQITGGGCVIPITSQSWSRIDRHINVKQKTENIFISSRK